MSNDILRRQDTGAVAVLTLADGATRNSLSDAMLDALDAALKQIDGDPAVRCVVVTGEGPVFSSGHNLKELQGHRTDADAGRGYAEGVFGRCAAVMTAITRLRVPVIAAVEGLATAAGCQLVASCDLAIAGADAGFCTPGVNIGLFCSTPGVAVARTMTPKHALELLLTGDTIDADTAQRFGLVNRVVPAGQALPAALELAQAVTAKSGESIGFGKRAFYDQLARPLDDAYAAAARVMVENFLAGEAAEGISALLGKRQPAWRAS